MSERNQRRRDHSDEKNNRREVRENTNIQNRKDGKLKRRISETQFGDTEGWVNTSKRLHLAGSSTSSNQFGVNEPRPNVTRSGRSGSRGESKLLFPGSTSSNQIRTNEYRTPTSGRNDSYGNKQRCRTYITRRSGRNESYEDKQRCRTNITTRSGRNESYEVKQRCRTNITTRSGRNDSYEDKQRHHSSRDNGNRNDEQNCEVRPMGFKVLQEMLRRESSDILLCLMAPRSGFKECLNLPQIEVDLLFLLLKVLAKSFVTELHPTIQNSLMSVIMTSDLFQHHTSRLLCNPKIKDNLHVFDNLSSIFGAIISRMPDTSSEQLEECVRQCIMIATLNNAKESTLEKLQGIQMKIETIKEQKNQEVKEKRKANLNFDSYNDEPPEDFREIVVSPTIEEIRYKGKPFLRANLIEGAFKNADHYLDVHFRLLREDFLAPLRSGINDYLCRDKSATNKKIREIRLYENVVIKEAQYNRGGVLYTVQFAMNRLRNVKWQVSRRLIFGSLVCLSSDNFETALFASVADRNPNELIQGRIQVKFEDELELKLMLDKSKLNRVFVMAESQAYYEAYRHVLKGLQSYNATNLPLQNYIVHVQCNVDAPKYLNQGTKYDFLGVLDNSGKVQRVQKRLRFSNQDYESSSQEEVGELQKYVMYIEHWPLALDLGLDESQRRAMHLALTSALAIIQGPPGTGKTYVGLKIMQMLLANKSKWRTENETNPILVVCLTNHALDQFLEGMLPFTNLLVRVGGRSKSERLSRYNLKYIQKTMSGKHLVPRNIFVNLNHEERELRRLRELIEIQQNAVKLLNSMIPHESCFQILDEDDNWLIRSFIHDFIQVFGVDPRNEPWCPESFLAVWLGLTLDEFVSDNEINDFLFVETRRGAAIALPPLNPNPNVCDVDEEEDDIKWIDVEDQYAAMNRNRQEEADEDEIVISSKVLESLNLHCVVDIDKLTDLDYLNIRNENKYFCSLYLRMGAVRQQIAKRELAKLEIMGDEEVRNIRNLWNLSLQDRWRLYRRWIAKYRQAAEIEIVRFQTEYETTAKKYKEVINAEELEILRNNDIIGMTTTGAAKYLSIFRELGPKIVVVEEAAEVLESHIITSLSPTTEHLILIGDHQQLRPTLTVYQLAQNYHLDVSLFERLIKNGIHFETLELQHRMRPEISRLLVPHIYKNLKDHPSVNRYPHVRGMSKDVFFLTHTNPEESVADSTTRSNSFEAEFLVGLCSYLLQQGYEPNQITILTTYAGQLFALRNLMPRSKFEGVQVTVVDNFQGEENDIILLSFVRSNEDGTIGFLKIDNRVNVALSRAKHGLYCVGNFRFFASRSEFWRGIVSHLERENSIGNFMTLKCQKHGNETTVSFENDFKKLAPEGGCLNECGDILECEHHCKRVCHVTPHTRCEQTCRRILCALGHKCSLKCYLPCEPCKVLVKKKHINCDHMLTVPCHVDISTKKCPIIMNRLLPKCGHITKLECHVDIDNYNCSEEVLRNLPNCNHKRFMYCYEDSNQVSCKVPCDFRLECGHVCPLNCHSLVDVEHENVDCKKKCEKEICDRGHKCQNLCCQPCSDCVILVEKKLSCGHEIMHPCSKPIVLTTELYSSLHLITGKVQPCQKQCKLKLPCGHPCKKICSNPCENCQEKVVKVLSCGHKIRTECKKLVSSIICPSPCVKTLPCGHKCDNKCGEDCQSKCKHLILRPHSCGHSVEFPCYLRNASLQEISKYCNHPCGKVLPCEHECQGTCGTCRQGRVHVPCQNKCGKVQICGHACEFPCATVCPPCNRKCATRCNHSRCAKRCGQLCVECNEDCTWRCKHHQCSKKCSEMCDRPRCDVPCKKKLRKCGHPCIGLCGEVCPELCRICDKEELTEFIIFGYEDEPDARFIQLKDCKHCIEVRALDHWMDMNDDEIQMKGCPRCKTTIFQSYRYGNVIKRRLEDVHKVKAKIFGECKFLRKKMNEVRLIIQTGDIKVYFPKQHERIVKLLSGRHALHQNKMVVIENQVNILKVMSTMKRKIANFVSRKARNFFEDQIELLLSRLMKNEEKIAEWELEAISNELRRVELWTNYIETENYISNIDNAVNKKHLSDAYYLLASHLILTDHEEDQIRDHLKKASSLSGLGISETERIEIVNAIGLKSGHWYKCPNGHIYAIGECGGAMQVSKCNECGALIGGQSHRLQEDNAHAGEMDGSVHPAYGDHVGLGNYDLHDLL